MGYWLKEYMNGTSLLGEDSLVEKKYLSWSRSPMEGIDSVQLGHDGYILRIEGPGHFWQSDTFEATFPNPKPTVVKRRILRQVHISDQFIQVFNGKGLLRIAFNKNIDSSKFMAIPPSWLNKWLVLEYDVGKGEARFFIQEGRG